jgi:hypothetical protein
VVLFGVVIVRRREREREVQEDGNATIFFFLIAMGRQSPRAKRGEVS